MSSSSSSSESGMSGMAPPPMPPIICCRAAMSIPPIPPPAPQKLSVCSHSLGLTFWVWQVLWVNSKPGVGFAVLATHSTHSTHSANPPHAGHSSHTSHPSHPGHASPHPLHPGRVEIIVICHLILILPLVPVHSHVLNLGALLQLVPVLSLFLPHKKDRHVASPDRPLALVRVDLAKRIKDKGPFIRGEGEVCGSHVDLCLSGVEVGDVDGQENLVLPLRPLGIGCLRHLCLVLRNFAGSR
mmetsp:Transcript_58291/g.140520  ORF Transcript_58291/g.140520 Transcript_58291/m.140520 type:complete len:241 (+) Transcript_58291:361-1083(+)